MAHTNHRNNIRSSRGHTHSVMFYIQGRGTIGIRSKKPFRERAGAYFTGKDQRNASFHTHLLPMDQRNCRSVMKGTRTSFKSTSVLVPTAKLLFSNPHTNCWISFEQHHHREIGKLLSSNSIHWASPGFPFEVFHSTWWWESAGTRFSWYQGYTKEING